MKTTRIVIGCIFAAIAVGICTASSIAWSNEGCGVSQILVGITFYTSCLGGLWFAIDSSIK